MKRHLLTGFLTLWTAASLLAQPGPDEMRLIRGIQQFLGSTSPESVDRFVDEYWASSSDAPDREELISIREKTRGKLSELGVDRTDSGFVFILGEADPVRLSIETTDSPPYGILAISVEEEQEAGGPDAVLRSHVFAIETLHRLDPETAVEQFSREHLSPSLIESMTDEELSSLIESIRSAAARAGGVTVSGDEAGTHVSLLSRRPVTVSFQVEGSAPWRITELVLREDTPEEPLGWDDLEERFERAAAEGLSGIVQVIRDGEPFLTRAFGYADKENQTPHSLDTVYGIGSTPIDFTIAGILLLAQRGELELDDPISNFFDDVPQDKRSMTLRHLMEGMSGLPDFHEIPGVDWDFDLGWIDRETAVDRILSKELLFAPGESRAHSHSAFGLLAAVIEIVSGDSYQDFVRRELFEPAGMSRTGFYGETLGLDLDQFAIGYGESSVGLPNIPPNWGPTSWLVMGSGGMFSTPRDMLRYYETIESGKILTGPYLRRISGPTADVGGSQRGFLIIHTSSGVDDRVLILANSEGRTPEMRSLIRELMAFMRSHEED